MRNTRGLVCASLSGDDRSALEHQARNVNGKIDLFEIRLDTLKPESINPAAIASCFEKPLLFTNRAVWEGGHFNGSEEDRVDLLLKCMQSGCAYIDIELKTEQNLRNTLLSKAQTKGSKVIISYHDFDKTPSPAVLQNTLEQMQESGADAGKIVTTATTQEEVVRVLNLFSLAAEMDFTLSAFCMGPIGRISRMASLYLGGFMTYVAPNAGEATAPGQFSAEHFQDLISLFEKNA